MKITWKAVTLALLAIAAAIAFVLTVLLLLLDRPASATIAAALVLSFILLCKLPILESFEVLTLKVKLRHQMDEAGELLSQIRSNAAVTSKLLYLQLGFMNRLGSVSWGQKRALLSDVDGMLNGLDFPKDKIGEWKRPFMNLISRDFLSILWGAIEHIKRRHRDSAQNMYDKYSRENSPVREDDETHRALLAAVRRFDQCSLDLGDMLQRPDLADTKLLTQSWIEPGMFDAEELKALEVLRGEVVQLVSDCWAQGTITPEAERYLDEYGLKIDTRIQELLTAQAS